MNTKVQKKIYRFEIFGNMMLNFFIVGGKLLIHAVYNLFLTSSTQK